MDEVCSALAIDADPLAADWVLDAGAELELLDDEAELGGVADATAVAAV